MEDVSGSGLTSVIQKGTFVNGCWQAPVTKIPKHILPHHVNLYAKQLGGKKKRKKKPNCYCMPLLHSAAIADITFGCKTLTEKDFVSKLRKSTYINVSDPCKHKHLYGAFVVRGNAEDL